MELDDVVETLKIAKNHNTKCCILIGVGCSVSADIPDADGFVKIIQENYPVAYKRATEKTYFKCMEQLSPADRHNLITDKIKQSKLNWGHIALAQLMKAGYVDRVLTTNFDSLLLRACALIGGIQPAVYDIPSSKEFNASMVSTPAIFHLHGQSSGFILINTPEEYDSQSALIGPVIQDVLRDHVWIVIGYSGENDPTFDLLAQNPVFDNRLYWIGFEDNEPSKKLRENLLLPAKETHFVKGYDFDSFFGKLAGKLDCFPPDFVRQPFSYMDSVFETITPYSISKTNEPINYVRFAREFIREAIQEKECIQKDVLQAMSDLMSEQYDNVLALQSKYTSDMHKELIYAISWANVMVGNQISNQAKTKTGKEADDLFTLAYEKYAAALQIKPDKHEALINWGSALSDQAKTKTGKEADDLFTLAYEKYAAALQIKPDKHEALNNWGLALSDQAKTKTGKEADDLFTLAYEKINTKPWIIGELLFLINLE
jgi:hypothetical protein